MQDQYETPELTMIGQADEVIMGTGVGGNDYPWFAALDFEFEQD